MKPNPGGKKSPPLARRSLRRDAVAADKKSKAAGGDAWSNAAASPATNRRVSML